MSGLTIRVVAGFPENVNIMGNPDVSYEFIDMSNDELVVVKKYDRDLCVMKVAMDLNIWQHNPVFDLSLWGDRFYWMPNIRVEFISDEDTVLAGRVTGFEHYPELRSLCMNVRYWYTRLADREDYELYTSDLRGIEFCSKLENLAMCGHNVSDLSPIIDLPLKNLSIGGNPITSLDPINFETLEHLEIDSSHLDLFTESHNLSKLKSLTVYGHPACDILTHPWIVSITEKFGLRLETNGIRGLARRMVDGRAIKIRKYVR